MHQVGEEQGGRQAQDKANRAICSGLIGGCKSVCGGVWASSYLVLVAVRRGRWAGQADPGMKLLWLLACLGVLVNSRYIRERRQVEGGAAPGIQGKKIHHSD